MKLGATDQFMSELEIEPCPIDSPGMLELYGRDGPFRLWSVRTVSGVDLPRLPLATPLPGYRNSDEIAKATEQFTSLTAKVGPVWQHNRSGRN